MIYWNRRTALAVRDRYRRILDAWSTPHGEQRIPTSQGETFVLTAGRPDAPAVVLLPGSMATSAMWLPTIDALVDRFRLIAVDIVGDAGFSAPSRPALRSDAHARWLDDVLDALDVQAAGFVGASFGGWVALDHAVRRGARVRSLVLLAPAGVGRIRPGFLFRKAPLLLLGPWGHRKALDLDMGYSPQDPRLRDATFLGLFATVQSGFVARTRPMPVFPDRDLRRLGMPVLAVVGGRDVLLDSRETQRRIEANVKNSRVLMLPDAGHGLIEVTALIRDFLLGAGSPAGRERAG